MKTRSKLVSRHKNWRDNSPEGIQHLTIMSGGHPSIPKMVCEPELEGTSAPWLTPTEVPSPPGTMQGRC